MASIRFSLFPHVGIGVDSRRSPELIPVFNLKGNPSHLVGLIRSANLQRRRSTIPTLKLIFWPPIERLLNEDPVLGWTKRAARGGALKDRIQKCSFFGQVLPINRTVRTGGVRRALAWARTCTGQGLIARRSPIKHRSLVERGEKKKYGFFAKLNLAQFPRVPFWKVNCSGMRGPSRARIAQKIGRLELADEVRCS